MPLRWRALVAMALLAVLVLACALAARLGSARTRAQGTEAQADFPVDVVDERGKTLHLQAAPQRIVSLLASHTEVLVALGVGDHLVLRDARSDHPESIRSLPAITDLGEASLQRLFDTQADLVLASEVSGQAEQLERLHVPVWAGSAQRFDEIFETFRQLGRLTGRRLAAEELCARVRAEVDRRTQEAASWPRVRVYFEVDPSPYSVGPRSFVGELLRRAGGDNIVDEQAADYPRLSPEAVVTADPDVMIGLTLAEATARPGWARLRAVRSGRVYALSEQERDVVQRPGPRLAQGLAVLMEKLHAPAVAAAAR